MSTVKADEEALQRLKTEVLATHGKLRGALQTEVSAALRDRAEKLAGQREGS